MENLNQLSVAETARRIDAGGITAEAVVRDCLARIEEREPVVHAWAFLDPELALQQARECDRGPVRGPLHGVPVGVKDVLDTFDMPTQMGSPIYQGHQPANDAACVALLRAAGAVILGKTVTCEFAGQTPGETTNPHNPAHTPGGSSSGSGAAVADFMVPAAFGTQTGGSVLRPASFCGIVGYKPTYGTFNREGLKFAAECLDTIGLLTRNVDDAELLAQVLVGGAPSPTAAPIAPPRIGLCRTFLWDQAQPETVAAVEDAAARFKAAGATVVDVELPDRFSGLGAARDAFNDYERGRAMADEWNRHRDLISERLRIAIQRGRDMDHGAYVDALRLAEDCRRQMASVFEGFDVLLAPSVAGEAPEGLEATGDPRFQGLWTLLHLPTITLPTHSGPNGLPVGIQLIAPAHEDSRLFAVSRWAMDLFGDG